MTAFSVGVDIGSVATKCVALADGKIAAQAMARTGADAEKSAEAVFAEVLKAAGAARRDVGKIMSTGYGRRIFKGAHKVVTEISAAARGAHHLSGGRKCVVVDVGGQDTKIIEVEASGSVADFLMNDKCAAGTGRFLEMMASALETDIEGLSALAMKSASPVVINSTCSVFAESEIVSLIHAAAKKEDIAAGLFDAISMRIAAMMKRFGPSGELVFCGGGAKSPALKAALEKASGRKIITLDNPQFVVALGAALLAG